MIIGLMTIDLYIPHSSSLKEKRMVLKGFKDKIRARYNVSVSEVDFQEKWQRAQLAVVQVGNDYQYIEKNLRTIFQLIESNGTAQILNHSVEFI